MSYIVSDCMTKVKIILNLLLYMTLLYIKGKTYKDITVFYNNIER